MEPGDGELADAPQAPRDYDLAPDLSYAVRPVAVLRSPFRVHHGTPRQPGVGTACDGFVVVRQGMQNLLQDLDGFSHVWLIGHMCYARGWNDTVIPPRDPDRRRRGLFATRAPHRPNPIAISVVELKEVRRRVLRSGAHDFLDGTPILDIKPYLAYCDAVPDARAGWVDGIEGRALGDHRVWWEEDA
ncbi:MAG: tRNA (N6-threonylcarbamoyladenosine(37)-N6)-methyltransferase TrmO [Planctomycetota bacterium]